MLASATDLFRSLLPPQYAVRAAPEVAALCTPLYFLSALAAFPWPV